jgi:hypothetical protein
MELKGVLLCFLLFCIFLVFDVNAVTVQVNSTEDTYVNEASPQSHYSTSNNLQIGTNFDSANKTYVYVRFSFSLPSNIEILNANVSMYNRRIFGDTPKPIAVYHIRYPYWSIDEQTWNTQVCGINFSDSYYCDSSPEDTINISLQGTWYTWNITDVVRLAYNKSLSNIDLFFKVLNDTAYGTKNNMLFNSSETSLGPYMNIEYIDIINVTLGPPFNNTYFNSNEISFNCTTWTNSNLTNISLYTDVGGAWQLVSINASGVDNATYVFNQTIPTNGTYHWNCMAIDSNGNSFWGPHNYTFVVDTSQRPPTPLQYGASPSSGNPYENLTLYSKWFGHLNNITKGYVEENSNGFFVNHSVSIIKGWINFTLVPNNFSRNQVIQFRFHANNSDGWNSTPLLNVTVSDFWEPQDIPYRSFKKTLSYILTYLYNPSILAYGVPISHDNNPSSYTLVRTVQSSGLISAIYAYFSTFDVNYLNVANDIANWIINDQHSDGYYKYLGSFDEVDNVFTSVVVAKRLLILSSLTGNITYQKSAKRALDYHISNSWETDHFKDDPSHTGRDKINFNSQAARAYAYACYFFNDDTYCDYANKTLYWLKAEQLSSGAWPYRDNSSAPQSEGYNTATLWSALEALYWLDKKAYYEGGLPLELSNMTRMAISYLEANSSNGTFFYNSDDTSPGRPLNMIQFANMFALLAAVEKNSSYANWTWKQLDYMINVAPGKQNENGSWDSGDITASDSAVSTWFTTYTAGFLAEVFLFQNKPNELVNIHQNVSWRTDEPFGIVNVSLDGSSGNIIFKKTIYALPDDPPGGSISNWNWSIGERFNFSNSASISVFGSDGTLNVDTIQNGSVYRFNASVSGAWNLNQEKNITYIITSPNIASVTRTKNSKNLTYEFGNLVGDLTTKTFILSVPSNFRFNGSITYIPYGWPAYGFVNGSNASVSKEGNNYVINLDYYVPVKVSSSSNTIVLHGSFSKTTTTQMETSVGGGGSWKCESNWVCSEWEPSVCPEDGVQRRTCVDENGCLESSNKPAEIRSCEPGDLIGLSIKTPQVLMRGDKVRVLVEIDNLGISQDKDLIIVYGLKRDDNLVYRYKEKKRIGDGISFVKELDYELKAGDYVLNVEIIYNNRVYSAQSEFSVRSPLLGPAKPSLVFLIVLMVIVLFVYLEMRRRLKYKKYR